MKLPRGGSFDLTGFPSAVFPYCRRVTCLFSSLRLSILVFPFPLPSESSETKAGKETNIKKRTNSFKNPLLSKIDQLELRKKVKC